MSWLFKSLQSNDPDSSQHQNLSPPTSPERSSSSPTNRGGVKEDLSVLGETIGRQLRGVAAFLAPPPSPPSPAATATTTAEELSDSSSQTLLGIRNDLVEIGGSFKSRLSLLSSNKAVTEISRFASNLLPFQNQNDDGDDYDYDDDDPVPGITEEVLDFVKEISMRPECWTDFPLSLEPDFRMSGAQREHAYTIEHLAPSFAALRVNLLGCMRDEQFWMIYFILLLPRLNEHDFKLLSTPQIVETRNVLLQKLRNKRNVRVNSENSHTPDTSLEGGKDSETKPEDIPSGEKEVTEIINAAEGLEIDEEENTEQWLEESDIDTCTSTDAQKKLEHEEDVSFSDLEDDDNHLSPRPTALRPAQDIKTLSPNESNDWVQLNETTTETRDGQQKGGQSISRDKDSEGEESNDWLTVDDFD